MRYTNRPSLDGRTNRDWRMRHIARSTIITWWAQALAAVGHALALAGSMTWEITWALILGFVLSAVVQAVVRRSTVVSLLATIARAPWPWRPGLVRHRRRAPMPPLRWPGRYPQGRQLHRRHGVEIGSTNLVVELGINFGAVDGLAVHRRGVRRRTADDRGAGNPVPALRAHSGFSMRLASRPS